MSEKREILRNALGRHWNSGGEMLFRCPKCQHDKLKMSVNIEKNAFGYFTHDSFRKTYQLYNHCYINYYLGKYVDSYFVRSFKYIS